MSSDTIEARVLLRRYWRRGLSTRASADEINDVEEEGTTGKSAAARWFKHFNDGDLSLEDTPRSGQPKYSRLVRRKRALFQQDNTKSHTANKTKEKFKQLDGVEVLPHPVYSPDVTPSDYGFFRSVQHFLRGRRFESFDEVEEACQEFFDSKPKEWYFNQIRNLAGSCRK